MIDTAGTRDMRPAVIEVGKTGAELKKALKDADEFVSGMESGLKIVIAEHAKLLSEINKMPEGNARNQLLEEYRNEAVEIEKVSAHLDGSFRLILNYYREDSNYNKDTQEPAQFSRTSIGNISIDHNQYFVISY